MVLLLLESELMFTF